MPLPISRFRDARPAERGTFGRILDQCAAVLARPGVPSQANWGLVALLDFHDLVGDQTVRFLVHGRRRLGVSCFDETVDRAVLFVEPVLLVVDALLALRREVCLVGIGDSLGGESFDGVVRVHEQRH